VHAQDLDRHVRRQASEPLFVAPLLPPEVIVERARMDLEGGIDPHPPPMIADDGEDALGDFAEEAEQERYGPAAVGRSVPAGPTRAELDRHELTHCIRCFVAAWCPTCVSSKGTEDDH
jgi:hypothetical protein